MGARKVLCVVWRRVWLQSVRRHYVATVLEVACVVGLAYLMVPVGAPLQPRKSRNGEVEAVFQPPRLVYPPKNTMGAPGSSSFAKSPKAGAVYGPKNAASEALIRAAFPNLPAANITAVDAREDVLEKCHDVWSASDRPADILCIQFSALLGQADDSGLEYKLHRVAHDQIPELLPLPRPDRFYLHGEIATTYVMEDMLDAQARLDYAYLQSKKKATYQIPPVLLRELPQVPPASDSMEFRISSIVLTTMVYCLPLLRRISAVTNELSTGLKDEQQANGLSMPAFWFGHFLSALVIQMVETTAIVGIMFKVSHYGVSCFFNHSDNTLVTFVMLLFNICHILQGMLFAAVCQSGKLAMSMAVMLAFMAPLAQITSTQTLGQLVFRDRQNKLLEAISPQLMGSHVLKTLAYYDDYEGGAGWGVLFKRALDLDSVTLFELLAAMCAAAAFYVFLLFYATNVLPWATETPQPPLFFLMPGYWRPSPAMPTGDESATEEPHPDRFEEPPEGEPAADVRHLSVVFGSHKALDDVNLKIYASQVTVLLGQNGAGKTTLMRTLTGLQRPTSGFVKIGGDTHGTNTTAFCQQHDVHFPDLTVNEHLIYYGHLQDRGGLELTRLITETLEAVKLTDKVHCFSNQLSGGMKRRLSMCIALVAHAKVLIFDEPTTGMDPETRRSIWDLISSLRSSSTILLSTHDMEEAEVLADRIIIMSAGKVLGAGSTAFLKKACGVGYTINLITVPEKFVAEHTLEVVQKTAPEAIVKDVKQGSAIIALQTIEHNGFADMFRTLETEGEDLGIESFGVTVATIADVYIKINKLWTVDGTPDTEGSPAEGSPPVQTTLCSGVATYPSSTQRVRALLTKRFLYWSRSPISILVGWLGTMALFVTYWEPIRAGTSEQPRAVSNLELQSSVHFRGGHCFVQAARPTDFTRHFEDLAKSEGVSVVPMTNATKELVEFARKDFASYYMHYAYGVADTGTG